jgi:hypothetical protein
MDLIYEEDRQIVREAFERARDPAGPGDFTAEYRIMTPAGEARWVWSRGRMIRDDEGPRLLVGTSLDMTERRAAEERRNLLTRELAHRAKNFISVVMSIVGQTARGQESVQEFRDLLMARLQSMAASQDLVTTTGGHAIDVSGVIAQSLAPFDIQRFEIDGGLAEVSIESTVAVGMGLCCTRWRPTRPSTDRFPTARAAWSSAGPRPPTAASPSNGMSRADPRSCCPTAGGSARASWNRCCVTRAAR